MELHPDFRDLLAEFAQEDVKFMVIGGYAVGHHDRPRYTKDIDLWLESGADNVASAVRALLAFGAPEPVANALQSARKDEIVWIGTPPLRVDFLQEIPGVQFRDAWKRRVVVTWGDQVVPVISLDDLITAKRAAAREQDLTDVRNLEQVRDRRSRTRQ